MFSCSLKKKTNFKLHVMIRIRPLLTSNLRNFSTSAFLLKKKPKGKTVEQEPVDIIDVQKYITDAKEKFTKALDLHQQKLNTTRQATTDIHMFDKLKLTDGTVFTDVASTSVRGKNSLLITVFDPQQVKKVVSCILAAGLNLNPERVAGEGNEQLLVVPLPPQTRETRLLKVKELKEVYETFRNSNMHWSLSHIRKDSMQHLKKVQQDDSVKKAIKELENIHKEYANKLTEQYKQVEKNLMN